MVHPKGPGGSLDPSDTAFMTEMKNANYVELNNIQNHSYAIMDLSLLKVYTLFMSIVLSFDREDQPLY